MGFGSVIDIGIAALCFFGFCSYWFTAIKHVHLDLSTKHSSYQICFSFLYFQYLKMNQIKTVFQNDTVRKELLSLISCRRYKEMMLASLEKKHLRLSPIDMRFHLHDRICSGHLKTISTPSGLVVHVSKD